MVEVKAIRRELAAALLTIRSQVELISEEAAEALRIPDVDDLAGVADADLTWIDDYGIAGQALAAWDFTWAPETAKAQAFGQDDLQDVTVFILGLPKCDREGKLLHQAGLELLLAGSHARAKLSDLERDDDTFRGFSDPLTIPEVAAIGGLSERAVRNAVSRGELRADRQPTDLASGEQQAIEPEVAHAWLQGRRGFTPWPDDDGSRQRLIARGLQARSRVELGETARQIFERGKPETAPTRKLEQFFAGRFKANVTELLAIADLLAIDDRPTFVGKAVTLALLES